MEKLRLHVVEGTMKMWIMNLITLLLLCVHSNGTQAGSASCASCLEDDDLDYGRLIKRVRDDCEYAIDPEDMLFFRRLLCPDMFLKFRDDVAEAEEKDRRKGTGTKYMCKHTVASLVREMSEESISDEEYAEETANAFRVLLSEGTPGNQNGLIVNALLADFVSSALLELASSAAFQNALCSSALVFAPQGTGSCSTQVGSLLRDAGVVMTEAPLKSAAAVGVAFRSMMIVSDYHTGKLTRPEMELKFAAAVAEEAGGAVGAAGGCAVGAAAASLLYPPAAAVACSMGMVYGYEIGARIAREVLGYFLDGRLSELDKLEHCRKLLGGVQADASINEINKAFRKASRRLHPDKGGTEKEQIEAQFCVGLLRYHQSQGGTGFAQELWDFLRFEAPQQVELKRVEWTSVEELNERWEDTEESTTMWNAIKRGQYNEVVELLSRKPALAHIRSKDGRGPMWWAQEFGRPSIVALLASVGVRDDRRDGSGKTPLDLLQLRA